MSVQQQVTFKFLFETDAVTEKDTQLYVDDTDNGNEPVDNTVDNQLGSSEIRNQVVFDKLTSAEELLVTNEDVLPDVLYDESLLSHNLELQNVVVSTDEERLEMQQEKQLNHKALEENIAIQTDTSCTAEHFDGKSFIWECVVAFENWISGLDRWINILIDHVSFIFCVCSIIIYIRIEKVCEGARFLSINDLNSLLQLSCLGNKFAYVYF